MKKVPKYTLVSTHRWKAQKLKGAASLCKKPDKRLERRATAFQLYSLSSSHMKSCSLPDHSSNFHTVYMKKREYEALI